NLMELPRLRLCREARLALPWDPRRFPRPEVPTGPPMGKILEPSAPIAAARDATTAWDIMDYWVTCSESWGLIPTAAAELFAGMTWRSTTCFSNATGPAGLHLTPARELPAELSSAIRILTSTPVPASDSPRPCKLAA